MDNFLDNFTLQYNTEQLEGIIESLLFTSGDPIAIHELAQIIGTDEKNIRNSIVKMNLDYDKSNRGIFIAEFNNKVQLATKPEYAEYIRRLIKPGGKQNLSQASLETLAIVAYKQPVTRADIDEIRGVRSDRAVATLIDRDLIKESGRLEAPGRPILYETTENFLKYFGFKSIKELPELVEFNMGLEEE